MSNLIYPVPEPSRCDVYIGSAKVLIHLRKEHQHTMNMRKQQRAISPNLTMHYPRLKVQNSLKCRVMPHNIRNKGTLTCLCRTKMPPFASHPDHPTPSLESGSSCKENKLGQKHNEKHGNSVYNLKEADEENEYGALR